MSSDRLSGIDVSKWQGAVSWPDVKRAGQAFAYARATYGSAEVDPRFDANWREIKEAGIFRGAYHFFVTADDAAAQADLFVRAVGGLAAGDLPPVLDVEAESGAGGNLVSGVQTWLDIVEQRLGRRPAIYTGPAFWNEHLTGGFGRYPLWVAEYGVSSPRPVNGWGAWTFWQHSQSGAIPGVAGSVDLDYFNGSLADLETLANATAGSTASTPPAETAASTQATNTLTPTPTRPAPATSTPTTPAPTTPTPTHADTQTYTVRPGDTLSAIAARHGTTADAIAQANHIRDENLIDVGQVLTIP